MIESFLKVARPDQQWNESCISNIYQVGNKSKPKIFREFSDYELKRFLFTGRAALRDKGVRFADVLTKYYLI